MACQPHRHPRRGARRRARRSRRSRRADPAVEPLEGRLASLHPQQGRRRRRRRSSCSSSSTACRRRSSRPTPERGGLRAGKQDPSLLAPVRHRQVRSRPLHAHRAGRPRLDPDRLRRDVRDPGSASSTARSRASSAAGSTTALMRFLDALYGLPTCRSRSSRWRSSATHGHVDDDDRALDCELVHDRPHRPRPVLTLKENDYVRAAKAVGARWHRILVRHILPNTLGVLIIADLPRAARASSSARRSSRSSVSGSARRMPRGARWRRRAATSTARHPIEIIVPSVAIALARPLRELHRRRPPRRARPADEGDVAVALLEVDDLRTHFFTREGAVRAVDGISFAVEKGKTLGIVGESGCGKSVTALSIMGLIPKPPAKIVTRLGAVRGTRPDEALGARARGRARPRDRDDLPGSDDLAEPDPDDRDADHGDDPAALRRVAEAGATRRRSSCSRRCGSRAPASGSRTTRTGSPAACASG